MALRLMFSILQGELTLFIESNETAEQFLTLRMLPIFIFNTTVSIPKSVSGPNGGYFPAICRLYFYMPSFYTVFRKALLLVVVHNVEITTIARILGNGIFAVKIGSI